MRMPDLRCASLAVLSLLVPAAPALAQTANLTSVADTTMGREETNESNGAGDSMFVGANGANAGGQLRRALVRFDLSSIPAGARVTGATLTLTATRTNAGAQTLQFHAVQAAWGEGTSDPSNNEGRLAAATAGDATWVNRVHPTTPWTTAGGDVASMPDATVTANGTGTVSVTGAAMASTVQRWLDNPATNHGWLVRNATETGTGTAIRFATHETATVGARPTRPVFYEEAPLLTDTRSTLDVFASGNMVNGNANSGFGGPVGLGELHFDSDGNGQLALGFVRGTTGNVNDTLVLYIDSVAGGEAGTASFTDTGDGSRAAISGAQGSNRSTLQFPATFRPDYAVAYDPDFGAFLFQLVPNGAHTFVAMVAAASMASAPNAVFSMSLSQLGVAAGARISVLGTYLSDTAFRSDEWFGVEVPSGNSGYAAVTIPPASFVRFQTYRDPCSPNPCQNGGSCTAATNGSPQCTCLVGFTGPLCETPACNPAACNDNNPCTMDMCAGPVCMHLPGPPAPCDDGDRCTTGEMCSAGACVGGEPVFCAPSSPCMDAACNPETGMCVQMADNTNACSDGSACTNDMCMGGTCVSVPNGTCASSSSGMSMGASSSSPGSPSSSAGSTGTGPASSSSEGASSAGTVASSAASQGGSSGETASSHGGAPSGSTGASSTDTPSSGAAASSGTGASSDMATASSAAVASSSTAVGSSSAAASSAVSLASSNATSTVPGSSSRAASGSQGASSNGAATSAAGTPDPNDGNDGCACESTGASPRPWVLAVMLGLVVRRVRRRRAA